MIKPRNMLKWLAVFFTLFIILIIVLADTGNLGILKIVNQIPYGDKAGHFVLYGILTLLIDLTLFRSLPFQNPMRVTVISGLMLALLIGIEELSQQFFASRTVSFQDLFAGYLGVIFFSWLALKINKP
ncbi:MAG TPA: VanZ family protein [Anaerolineales bacterium]|nr:VanZ family protein [Anaerolineales bacterium]